MKFLIYSSGAIVIGNLILGLLHVWEILQLNPDTWLKIVATSALLLLIFSVVIGVMYHLKEEKELRDNNMIN